MSKKKNQHYVWKNYLKSWANAKGQICCTRNGELLPASTNLDNLAVERYFYELKPLNDDEYNYLSLFLHLRYPKSQATMLAYINTLQKTFSGKEDFIEAVEQISAFLGNDQVPEECKEEYDRIIHWYDVETKNKIENHHTEEEHSAIPWLESLKRQCYDFYLTDEPLSDWDVVTKDERFQFLRFLCTQHNRTKMMKDKMDVTFSALMSAPVVMNRLFTQKIDVKNLRADHLTYYSSFVHQLDTAERLYKNKANITLLVNDTDLSFITSDQPVIDIFTDYHDEDNSLAGTCLYYPVSPQIAITISYREKSDKLVLDERTVDMFNQRMFYSSYEYVFADRKDILERCMKQSR